MQNHSTITWIPILSSLSLLQHGNTAIHDAARGRHPSTVQLLMNSDCRINMKNSQEETPIDIARQEGYGDVIAQLSGLGLNCNLEESCGCAQLRQILFHDKSLLKMDEIKKIKWMCRDGEDIANTLDEKIRRTSDTRMLEAEQVWQERLKLARAEVLAHCESRIAEVEEQCRQKVARIERQCSNRLQTARLILADGPSNTERIPSAPSNLRRSLSDSSSSISDFRTWSL